MKLKILAVSERQFGQFGTPGTYMLTRVLGESNVVRIIARPAGDLTVNQDLNVPLLPGKFGPEPINYSLEASIRHFAPDVCIIFASPNWTGQVRTLRRIIPSTRFVLDIKTPLLNQDVGARREIQREGDYSHRFLDSVFTLSRSSAETWFSRRDFDLLEYPLAIDVAAFSKYKSKPKPKPFDKTQQWVLASSFHRLRKIPTLLEGFAEFHRLHPSAAVLNIYGTGPKQKELEEYVRKLDIEPFVRFHGLVPQSELMSVLSGFDAGIAWVPSTVFNDSPSIKFLEYSAAGIPILATDTNAHMKMKDDGFEFLHCEDNAFDVSHGLSRLLESSRDWRQRATSNNLKAVEKFDIRRVVGSFYLPAIEGIVAQGKTSEGQSLSSAKNTIHDSPFSSNAFPNSSIRMGFVLSSLAGGKGGAERIFTELANNMAKKGHTVYVFFSDRGSPSYALHENVVAVPFQDLGQLREVFEGIGLDVLTVFYFNKGNLSPYAKIAKDLCLPLVVQECTNPDRLRFNNWASGTLSRARATWERELVTSSASRIRLVMPGYAASFGDFQQSQIRAMANGAPEAQGMSQPDVDVKGKWKILLVNGFKPNKNLPDALLAFARVSGLYPSWILRIVGKDPDWKSPYGKRISTILDNHNLWDRIEIAGPTGDIEAEFATSHIHLISSLSEGCPTVVLEAMAVGLPSVGFEDCPGTNELIEHNQNGLLADSKDRVSGLAASLSELMANPELRAELGNNARKDASKYDQSKIMKKWEDLILEAAHYREDPEKLFKEQHSINPERALHARRMRSKILEG